MENPGYIRTGREQMLKGGISDPRNKALMKMFNMIGIGERAGSGVPDIYAVWESQGWREPVIEEQYNPDRTILTLVFIPKQAEKTSGKNKRKKRRRMAVMVRPRKPWRTGERSLPSLPPRGAPGPGKLRGISASVRQGCGFFFQNSRKRAWSRRLEMGGRAGIPWLFGRNCNFAFTGAERFFSWIANPDAE